MMGYLRLLLALVVACGHLQTDSLYHKTEVSVFSIGPVIAVKMFFIISGFYMAMVFHKYVSARDFYLSRAMRLFPIYWLAILGCIIAASVLGRDQIPPFIDFTFWHQAQGLVTRIVLTFSNLSFLGLDSSFFFCIAPDGSSISLISMNGCAPGSFLGIEKAVIIPPAWTLALEWYFYLLVPAFFAMHTRSVIAVAAASFAFTLIITATSLYQILYRVFFPAELYLFLIGFLAYRLREYIPARTGACCAALSVTSILLYRHVPLWNWLNPTGLNFVLFFIFALGLPKLFQIGNKLPHERAIGDLSYPVYIAHLPIESVIYFSGIQGTMPMWGWVAFNVVVVIMISALLLLATRPIETMRLEMIPSPAQ
jgi:peptidoglycan/LPS O-acetylase OafA/YrhL